MKKLKLNRIADNLLSEKEMKELKGGGLNILGIILLKMGELPILFPHMVAHVLMLTMVVFYQ